MNSTPRAGHIRLASTIADATSRFWELSSADRAVVAQARRLERFLTQPFHVAEMFSGMAGQRVSIEDTLAGCERILGQGRFDDDESDYYMVGALEAQPA